MVVTTRRQARSQSESPRSRPDPDSSRAEEFDMAPSPNEDNGQNAEPAEPDPPVTENHVNHDNENSEEPTQPSIRMPSLHKQWKAVSSQTKRRILWAMVAFVYVFLMVLLSASSANQTSDTTSDKLMVCSMEEDKPRNPIQRVWQGFRNRVSRRGTVAPVCSAGSVDTTFAAATSFAPVLSVADRQVLRQWSLDAVAHAPSLRSNKIGWGGTHWKWFAADGTPRTIPAHIEGGKLMLAYYSVMKDYLRDDGTVTFPPQLCEESGCQPYDALVHTLQWRRAYQPWRMNPSAIEENAEGWVYTRGFSTPTDYGRHSMVWVRPGLHRVNEPLDYIRCILHSVDKAIAEALQHSNGRIGKFNVLVDATDYEWAKLPDFTYIRQGILMMQDHYPDRLGMIALINMSRTAEIFFNMIRPLLSETVKSKIIILSSLNEADQRADELAALVEPAWLPAWLGGPDEYEFDPISYYASSKQDWTDEESRAFETKMPYHSR